MIRVRRWVFLAGLAVALPACKKQSELTTGSGVGATKARPIGAFSSVRVSSGLQVDVSVGKSEPLEISGDDNLLEHVSARVENGTLLLDTDKKLKRKQPLKVRVGTEKLEAIRLGYSADAKVRGVSADAFRIELAGGSSLVVQGSCQRLEVITRTAAKADLSGFSAAKAAVTSADTSSVVLGHLEELTVTQSGLSRVTYRGDPKLTQNVTKPARLLHVE